MHVNVPQHEQFYPKGSAVTRRIPITILLLVPTYNEQTCHIDLSYVGTILE